METRSLGEGGPSLSVVGLGCNNFGMRIDAEASHAVVHAALDAGITHFDTAEMYGNGQSEEYLGEALGARRDEVVIASKYRPRPNDEDYEPGALARRIRLGCESSLKRLGTDRIDVFYEHFPDPHAPFDEMLDTLDELLQEGKVLGLACSNLSAAQIGEAVEVASERGVARFVGAQIEWNVLNREVERDVVPTARAAGMGIVPYYPLASGLLTGKYARGKEFPKGSRFEAMSYFAQFATDENFDRVDALTAVAASRGHTIVELAVAWLAAQPGVASVITGATSPEQLRANARGGDWHLTADDLAAVEAVVGPA
jgi:aryl-alcohol dehydrogenase-like predicted oxidoreductase